MMKHVTLVLLCAVFGAACGLPSFDSFEDEAQVEIVNAGDTDSDSDVDREADSEADGSDADSEQSGLGSAALDPDDEPDGKDPTDGQDGAATAAPAGQERIEQAGGADISLTGDEDRMTLNPARPTGGWGRLLIDQAYTVATIEDQNAAAGNKFIVIEYQIHGVESDNFFEEAFRLIADGTTYSPRENINEIVKPGDAVNSEVSFEIPAAVSSVQLEGGVPAGSNDGLTTIYNVELSPVTEQPVALPGDAEVERTAGEIELATDEARMSIDLGDPTSGWATLTIDGARTTARLDDTAAGPAAMFVEIEVQLLGGVSDNLFENAFRLQADDEFYPPLDNLNEILDVGEVYNGTLRFLVPRDAEGFVLEGGAPLRWTDGLRAAYSFSLWDSSESAPEASPDEQAAVSVEAEANSIVIQGSEDRMSLDLNGGPDNGWGTLNIDRATTTAKIEQNGARPGFKWLIVEYQLRGGETDNFFENALRVEADGELYSPRNNINEIIRPGDVYNGSVIFEVPAQAVEIRLEGGAAAGSSNGFTTNWLIDFG